MANEVQQSDTRPLGNIVNNAMSHNNYVDLEKQDQPTNQDADT